jgi:predicted anti-sigma-YlaC factor YlaD
VAGGVLSLPLLLLPLLLLALGGCSVRKLAVRSLAGALASSGDVFASDPDPELVGDALPFALKTMEALLAEDPTNRGLLVATSRGFTQYSYAFVQLPADRVEATDYARAEEMRARALALYLRARDYALRGLDARHPGIAARLLATPEAAAGELDAEDLELTYWAGASWGAAVAAGKDRPELLADLPSVRALLERVLALDERWGDGAVHEAFISLEAATPAALGGSPERARHHFARAVELSGGNSAGPFVTLAEAVAVPAQDRTEFTTLLDRALTVDLDAAPALRLANTLAQRRARWLLDQADDLFLDDETPDDETPDDEMLDEDEPLDDEEPAELADPPRADGHAETGGAS